jgi:hypothetical protein
MDDAIAGGPGRRQSHSSCRGRADLHVHTLYSDGGQSPEAVVRAAAGRLDVVAITDHDRVAGALRARDYAREHPELGVDVVIGEEVSTLNGHLLALYLEEHVPPGLTAQESIRRIHGQGGLAVAAHPFHPLRGVARGHRSLGRMIPDLALDAIEVVKWMLPVTAGSDAHDVWYLGSAFTVFPGDDAASLRHALEGGRTRARVEWSWTPSKMPRHVHIQSRSAIRFLQGGHHGLS